MTYACSLDRNQHSPLTETRLEHMYGQVVTTVPNRATWSAHCLNVAATVAHPYWPTRPAINQSVEFHKHITADKTNTYSCSGF